jgi:hypothetical protein
MGIKTERIRYNVSERGRQHRGTDRRFDLRALQGLVNGGEVQERVKNRDMHGYYGHWQRMTFGMKTGLIPPETVVVDGKVVNIEPAFITTYLRADSDGNIEHEAEFLDNASGKIAARLFGSKTGGFSSAMKTVPRGNLGVPMIFAGFDYVLEPNYTTNRGYELAFDSVEMPDGESVMLDSVMHFQHSMQTMNVLYDSLHADHALAMQTIQKLIEDNEELTSMHVRGGQVVLDSVEFQRPLMVDKRATQAFKRNAEAFRDANLVGFERQEANREETQDAALDQAQRHYGVK